MVEATQAYGIEEPSEAELQAQVASSSMNMIFWIKLSLESNKNDTNIPQVPAPFSRGKEGTESD